MMDKEKVIGGLAACTGEPHDCAGHTCPYFDFDDSEVDYGCRVQLELDALELLKEQETKTGHWIFESRYCEAWSHKCSECGKCMTTAVNTFANWCWNCGAKMT